MVSVKNEVNEVLLNCVSDLDTRLEESRLVLSDIQEKMDSKVNEAKEYKVQVDDAKDNIKRLESEIELLENDLVELKEKYSKKNLLAVIDAGEKEINSEVKKKQDEIQIHKNKIAELTNRARSIKDLLMNLKKDKKIKEEKLKDLENCANYYKVRLEEVVRFSEEHDDLDDYFVSVDDEPINGSTNIFEDIVGTEENKSDNIYDEVDEKTITEVSIEEAEEVFNDVISSEETEEKILDAENVNLELDELEFENEKEIEETEKDLEIEENNIEEDKIDFNDLVEEDSNENIELEGTTELKIADLLNSVKEPNEQTKEEPILEADQILEKLEGLNKTIDEEYINVFGQDINEPIKSIDGINDEITQNDNNEEDIVNKLTAIGLDYYSFTESDKEIIRNTFNEQIVTDIVNVLKDKKIQLDNIYVDGKILSTITPRELENIITKLMNAGQSADAIGFVLDKLPLVDVMILDATISNYGDYIHNVDIVDIIFKSLKGEI